MVGQELQEANPDVLAILQGALRDYLAEVEQSGGGEAMQTGRKVTQRTMRTGQSVREGTREEYDQEGRVRARDTYKHTQAPSTLDERIEEEPATYSREYPTTVFRESAPAPAGWATTGVLIKVSLLQRLLFGRTLDLPGLSKGAVVAEQHINSGLFNSGERAVVLKNLTTGDLDTLDKTRGIKRVPKDLAESEISSAYQARRSRGR